MHASIHRVSPANTPECVPGGHEDMYPASSEKDSCSQTSEPVVYYPRGPIREWTKTPVPKKVCRALAIDGNFRTSESGRRDSSGCSLLRIRIPLCASRNRCTHHVIESFSLHRVHIFFIDMRYCLSQRQCFKTSRAKSLQALPR